MATAIICILLFLVVIFSIKSYARKLAHGCCGSGDAVQKVKVKDKNALHYPYCALLKIAGMSCKNCALRVENALNSLNGVWAQVNLGKGTAVVHFKSKMSAEQLATPVCRVGYSVLQVQFTDSRKAA